MKKYGQDNFTIELIEECNLDMIYETEKKYVESYDSYNNGLNSTFGGEGCLGYTHSPEIKQKICKFLLRIFKVFARILLKLLIFQVCL